MKHRTLVALLLLATCTACQKKAEGQTVAVVNDEEITASQLNAELANANVPDGADKKAVTNRILQGLIDRRLLAEQARKDGIDRSPDFISRQQKLNEELLIGMLANRSMDTSKLPTDAEIAAFQAKQPQAFANREVWKLDQLQYDTPTDKAVQQRITATKTLEELAGVLTAARIPFQRGNNQLVTSVIPSELYPQLARLGPGEPFIVPAGNKSVASAIATREPNPLTGPNAKTEAVNAMRRQNSTTSLQQRLKELRSAAKIEYKEGFAPPAKK
ncbi:EpsD family peptidyl-prolyl cis-trans isomerase [Sphingomonas kaistensis]|uniref:peptidylprolyl isomerase n=1 Tax=Sphingomonas kaistensis TaxID=298708 RepID=A0A7X5Y3K1_9SPHN|nr:EpsD family peptidyl-prolyl cis-trans isomerase [Sphingomonas kaistensis]NJC04489.1 EpsD family peptidyl-prolyl cis-trans isomerase [Sphingomonas kaistensis]